MFQRDIQSFPPGVSRATSTESGTPPPANPCCSRIERPATRIVPLARTVTCAAHPRSRLLVNGCCTPYAVYRTRKQAYTAWFNPVCVTTRDGVDLPSRPFLTVLNSATVANGGREMGGRLTLPFPFPDANQLPIVVVGCTWVWNIAWNLQYEMALRMRGWRCCSSNPVGDRPRMQNLVRNRVGKKEERSRKDKERKGGAAGFESPDCATWVGVISQTLLR